jgi:Fe-S oxidoreductase
LYKEAVMKRSKTLITQALSTLKGNIERTGDPLGFRHTYWTDWANGLSLPREGKTVLLTARMYQMLPYVIQTTDMVASIKPLLAIKGFGKALSMGNRLAGETVIRLKAIGAKKIKGRGTRVLKGIIAALNSVGEHPAYLYEAEPYSGVLLYDLGLEEDIASHIDKVYKLLKGHGVEEVIAVDPHTTFMMKEIYPKYIENYDIRVKHYLEILSERTGTFGNASHKDLPKEFVMHDSCVMTRDLGIFEQARKVAAKLGMHLLEPENTKLDTACCGGPVEYAFADLSEKISGIRIQELASVCKNILVMCPICLINLSKYEQELGIKVWDMGELLHSAFISLTQ